MIVELARVIGQSTRRSRQRMRNLPVWNPSSLSRPSAADDWTFFNSFCPSPPLEADCRALGPRGERAAGTVLPIFGEAY
jgi:hypothetical protein